MRSTHFTYSTGIPLYSAAFLDEDHVVLAGGGGSSSTGIENRLWIYRIDMEKKTLLKAEVLNLSKEEDAPMTICSNIKIKALIAGINQESKLISEGKNDNLRVYKWDPSLLSSTAQSTPGILQLESKAATIKPKVEWYQKCCAFNRDGSMCATGGSDGSMTVLSFPELERLFVKDFGKETVYDVDFNDTGEWIAATGETTLKVYSAKATGSVATSDSGDGHAGGSASARGDTVQTIERPILGQEKCVFRSGKFGRGPTSQYLYTIVNTSSRSKSILTKWNTSTWQRIRNKTVASKPVTAFDVSSDGTLCAYGSSDLSLSVCDAETLSPLLQILNAHEFPLTHVRFNPTGTVLLSTSADNSVRVVRIPDFSDQLGAAVGTMSRDTMRLTLRIILAFVVVILAIGIAVRRQQTGSFW